jgi:hypothetical protein
MSRSIFPTILITVLLSGCAAAPVIVTGMGIGSVAINETTGRTVSDHAVSAVRDQDCRLGRAFRQEDVCQTDGTIKLQVTTTGVEASSVQEIESRYR